MSTVKVTQYLILLIATALMACAVSGANQNFVLFIGYLCFGMAGSVVFLHRGQETTALIVWGAVMLLFSFIFDSDRMLGTDYQPTAAGMAILWAVPIIVLVLRLAFWVIDRLRNPDAATRQRSGHPGSLTVVIGKTNHPAYPWLIGGWLLWPVGTALIAMLDDNRWDRMRYDNSLLLLMFVPPICLTTGFLLYRYWRDRKSEVDTPV